MFALLCWHYEAYLNAYYGRKLHNCERKWVCEIKEGRQRHRRSSSKMWGTLTESLFWPTLMKTATWHYESKNKSLICAGAMPDMSATAINSHLSLTGSWEIQWQLYQIHYLDAMLFNHSVSIKIWNHWFNSSKNPRKKQKATLVCYPQPDQSVRRTGGRRGAPGPICFVCLHNHPSAELINSHTGSLSTHQFISSLHII